MVLGKISLIDSAEVVREGHIFAKSPFCNRFIAPDVVVDSRTVTAPADRLVEEFSTLR
jgi:hypothetical protein